MCTAKRSITACYAILIVSLLAAPSLAAAAAAADPPHSDMEIPLFEGAYQIHEGVDPISGLTAFRYNVRMKPPAAEIIEFYDSYFNGNGWISSFEICQRHWDNSPGQPAGGEPSRQQMYTSWEHPDYNLKFVLWLIYDLGATQGAEEVTVDGHLQSKTDI